MKMNFFICAIVGSISRWNEDTKNPSVLEHAKKDDPNCTHDLYRISKTGSTSLYNAVMRDPSLHQHICWTKTHPIDGVKWHIPPPQNNTRPIITTLREPIELLRSILEYQGYATNDTKPVIARKIQTMAWVALRKKNENDIYLCLGGKNPPLHDQLRVYFHDSDIKSIPYENKNKRTRVILTNGLPLEHFLDYKDIKLWQRECT